MTSTNYCEIATAGIVDAVRESLACTTHQRVTSIRMPLLYADGDSIEVHIAPSYASSEIVVSDLGLAIARLESEGMRPRKTRLTRLLAGLGVQIDHSQQLFVKSDMKGLGDACLRLAQAMSNLSAVAYMRQTTTIDDFLQEFTAFLRSKEIAADRDVRRTVTIETKHGLSVQSPRVDFQLSGELLLMTVPASPAARARKIDQCYRAWNVLERAQDELPRLTVYDPEGPMSAEDANLLGDFSAVIAFDRLERGEVSLEALRTIARDKVVSTN